MPHAHSPREADCGSPARRYSGALLLLAIAGLLIACGGGGTEGSSWGSTSPAVVTPPNTAILEWEAPLAALNLSGYRVYSRTASGVYGSSVGVSSNVTTYTVPGLSSATTYYFVVTAYDTSNNESVFSNEVFKDIP